MDHPASLLDQVLADLLASDAVLRYPDADLLARRCALVAGDGVGGPGWQSYGSELASMAWLRGVVGSGQLSELSGELLGRLAADSATLAGALSASESAGVGWGGLFRDELLKLYGWLAVVLALLGDGSPAGGSPPQDGRGSPASGAGELLVECPPGWLHRFAGADQVFYPVIGAGAARLGVLGVLADQGRLDVLSGAVSVLAGLGLLRRPTPADLGVLLELATCSEGVVRSALGGLGLPVA